MFLLVCSNTLHLNILLSLWVWLLFQATISDLVQISPEDFSKFSAVAIEDNINEKYANKVRYFQLPQTACALIFWLGTFFVFFFFQRSYKKSVCAFVSMTCSSHQMAWLGTVLVWSTLTVRPNGKMHHDACKSRFRWLWWPVKFRMIVFRPFKGEILLGKITSGTENGIKSKSFRDRVICLEWILTVS